MVDSTHPPIRPAVWEQLRRAPLYVWLALTIVDVAVEDTEDEARAFDEALRAVAEGMANSAIVQSLVADAVHPSGKQRRGRSAADPDELLRRIGEIASELEGEVSPHESRQVRKFLYRFGYRVAESVGESLLAPKLRVSRQEELFLHELRRLLLPAPEDG